MIALIAVAALLPMQMVSATTIDGKYDQSGPVAAGSVFDLPVLGRGGVPSSGVGSVALNVTVTRPSASSYVTVWPTGTPRPNASNLNFVAGQTVPNMVIVPVGAGGQISVFNESGTTDVLVDVLGWFPKGAAFTGLTPARLLDSRVPSGGTVDGSFNGVGQLVGGKVFDLPVSGRGGVPTTGVGSVALNVTVARPSATSYLSVWPAGKPRPNASNLNFTPGQTVPNMVIVPVGANGRISIFNESGTTDVLVDVLGWFPKGPSFTGLTPARLLDSRIPSGGTVDGSFKGVGQLVGGTVFNLPVTGRGGVPASGVGSIALNVTVARPSEAGFLTVWPKGKARPNASNLNFVAGQTVPNMVIVPVGTDGQISIINESGTTDVLVDVLGWFPTTDSFLGLTPARLWDSRKPLPPPTTAATPSQVTIWNATDSQTTNSYWEPVLTQPANSVSPVNYAGGQAQIKIVIESKPSTRPMKALVCFWRHGTTRFQYETCRSAGVFSQPGTYRVALPAPSSWWKKGGNYDWTKQASVGRIMLVDPNTGKIFMNSLCGKACYTGGDLSSHVPVRMKSQLIFVAKGATFRPPAGW